MNPWQNTSTSGPSPTREPTSGTPSSVVTRNGCDDRYARDNSLRTTATKPILRLCYARLAVRRVLFLTDRGPDEVLPAALGLGADVKAEPATVDALARIPD